MDLPLNLELLLKQRNKFPATELPEKVLLPRT